MMLLALVLSLRNACFHFSSRWTLQIGIKIFSSLCCLNHLKFYESCSKYLKIIVSGWLALFTDLSTGENLTWGFPFKHFPEISIDEWNSIFHNLRKRGQSSKVYRCALSFQPKVPKVSKQGQIVRRFPGKGFHKIRKLLNFPGSFPMSESQLSDPSLTFRS